LVLHAENYPSVRDPLPDEIKDRGQVRAMWQWARDLDCDNLLWRECRPIERFLGAKRTLSGGASISANDPGPSAHTHAFLNGVTTDKKHLH
jgi:hypothetical protein